MNLRTIILAIENLLTDDRQSTEHRRIAAQILRGRLKTHTRKLNRPPTPPDFTLRAEEANADA